MGFRVPPLVVLAFGSTWLGCSDVNGAGVSGSDAASVQVGDGGIEHGDGGAGDGATPTSPSDASLGTGGSGASGGQGGSGGSGGSGGAAGTDAATPWDAGDCMIEGSYTIEPLDGGYAIVVADPPGEPCPDAALVCVLSIGDTCFGLFTYDGAGHRVYPITPEELEALPKGAPVSGYYGGPPDSTGQCMSSGIWGVGSCPLFGYWP